ncbi:MAG: galactokinase [Sphingorhabdus sp.]
MNPPDVTLHDKVVAAYTTRFGTGPSIVVRAPGRVNLIGEHTDYNDGFVLPCAIGPATMVAASRRADRHVHVLAVDFGHALDCFDLDALIGRNASEPWADYVRGMVDTLMKAGYAIDGADLAIAGNLPQGAGLSSSASLEIAIGFALLSLAGIEPNLTSLAQLAQAAECNFVGTKCGIMDQLISARGKEGHALLIDCRSNDLTDVAIPDDIAIMIVHSGVSRGLVDGAYNERRSQCEAAAKAMGVKALRDADLVMLNAAALDATTYARARHVIGENQRTQDAARALANSDLQVLGKLMAESHSSMRDDFAITVPPIDSLVEILQSAIGNEGGARMTGGGFGGACVALLPSGRVRDVEAAVATRYKTPAGEAPLIMIERPGPGVGLFSL